MVQTNEQQRFNLGAPRWEYEVLSLVKMKQTLRLKRKAKLVSKLQRIRRSKTQIICSDHMNNKAERVRVSELNSTSV